MIRQLRTSREYVSVPLRVHKEINLLKEKKSFYKFHARLRTGFFVRIDDE